MQGNLKELIPNADEFIKMPPAQLAEYLLLDALRTSPRFLAVELADYVAMHYSVTQTVQVKEAAMEALAWLMSEALVIPDFERTTTGSGWYRLSPRARKATANQKDVQALIRLRQILPKAFLHAKVTEHAVPIYLSGSYDTAVAEAFKQVEVVIRDATKLTTLVGVDLVRTAFRPANSSNPTVTGLLTDTSTLDAEQQGLSNLFAGAMAVFRNPSAHQNLNTTSQEAGSLLTFASHLIYIAEKHIAVAQQDGRL